MKELNTAEAYVSALYNRRNDDETLRKQRAQRRSKFTIGFTDSYMERTMIEKRRLLLEKSAMRSAKENQLINQLNEIKKWHEVFCKDSIVRHASQKENAIKQIELKETHEENLLTHECQVKEKMIEDDKLRCVHVIESRKSELITESKCIVDSILSHVIEMVERIIVYADDKQLPTHRLTHIIPNNMIEYWLVDHLSEEERFNTLTARHISMSLYGCCDKPTKFISPSFTAILVAAACVIFPKPPLIKPKRPTSWPILMISGPKFSGKSLVARTVANNLGMTFLTDSELVTRALEELTRDFSNSDLKDPLVSDLVDIGHEVQTVLLNGLPLSPNLIARLVVNRIHGIEDSNGIILDGTFSTLNGIKELEASLSNLNDRKYQPEMLLAPSYAIATVDDLAKEKILVKYPNAVATEGSISMHSKEKTKDKKRSRKGELEEEPLPPADLPPLEEGCIFADELELLEKKTIHSNRLGITRVVSIDCDPEVLFTRLAGIRIDEISGKEYHLDFDPPPQEVLEKLRLKELPEADCAQIYQAVDNFNFQWKEVAHWLAKFEGVHRIIKGDNLDTMIAQCQEIIIDAAREAKKYYTDVHEAAAIKSRQEQVRRSMVEANLQRNALKRQLLNQYIDRGVETIPPQLLEADWTESPFLPLSHQVATLVLDTVVNFTQYYSESVVLVHERLVEAMQTFHQYNRDCIDRFQEYLSNPDKRQGIVNDFVRTDMVLEKSFLSETDGKEELHLRIDQLSETLKKLVDTRKEEGLILLEAICFKSTCLDPISDILRYLASLLIQGELDRFMTSKHITMLYFGGLLEDLQMIDLQDTSSDIIPPIRWPSADAALDPTSPAKTLSKSRPIKKIKSTVSSDEAEKFIDQLVSVKEKASAIMVSQIDKLTILEVPFQSSNKKKGTIEVSRVANTAPGAIACPIVEELRIASEARMDVLLHFFTRLTDEIQTASNILIERLNNSLLNHYSNQMAAVNAAITFLRHIVEEENVLTHRIVLGLEHFALNPDTTLEEPEVIEKDEEMEVNEIDDTLVISCLNFTRLTNIIQLFKVCAPKYRLHREDFIRIVRQKDYTTKGCATCDVGQLFDRFDEWKTCVIDWREFIIHIMFWCEPPLSDAGEETAFGSNVNHYFTDGPELLQLFDFRSDLGGSIIDRETFSDAIFFFEENMPTERLNSYLSILWETFSVNGMLNPDTLVLFLCADEQPVRGMQKAFAMASPPADEPCALSPTLLDRVFHFSATNPRSLGVWSPFYKATLDMIFDLCQTTEISFQDLCATHVGRVLLNNAKCYRKKSFLK
eukprot:Tbor_TRINITY_DN5340_c0_g1::TRINITY_DN5340_c0_g1_i1::g.4439::m.4439